MGRAFLVIGLEVEQRDRSWRRSVTEVTPLP